MTRTIRPSTPADGPAIVALLAETGLRPNVEPQHLHWKYWQPQADSPGPRSFVLTQGTAILAHGANIHRTCVWEGRRVSTIHVIDWAARPGHIGAGAALMKHIAQQAGALLAVGGSDQTLQILPHIGFRSAGTVTGYVRALHPLRLLRDSGEAPWRRLPRLARSLAWTFTERGVPESPWQARRIPGNDLRRISAVLPVAVRGMAALERSQGLFNYTLSCPIVPMQLYSVERADRVRGYFLLAYAPGQIRIADCWMASDEPAEWRAMIQCAVEEGRHDPQAAEIVIWANDPLLSETLLLCGFRARQDTAIQIRATNGTAPPQVPVRVQMLDNDSAYLHEGRDWFWA